MFVPRHVTGPRASEPRARPPGIFCIRLASARGHPPLRHKRKRHPPRADNGPGARTPAARPPDQNLGCSCTLTGTGRHQCAHPAGAATSGRCPPIPIIAVQQVPYRPPAGRKCSALRRLRGGRCRGRSGCGAAGRRHRPTPRHPHRPTEPSGSRGPPGPPNAPGRRRHRRDKPRTRRDGRIEYRRQTSPVSTRISFGSGSTFPRTGAAEQSGRCRRTVAASGPIPAAPRGHGRRAQPSPCR